MTKQHMASGWTKQGSGWLLRRSVVRPESSVDSSFPSFFPRGKEAAIHRQRDAPRAWAEEFEGNESGSKVCTEWRGGRRWRAAGGRASGEESLHFIYHGKYK